MDLGCSTFRGVLAPQWDNINFASLPEFTTAPLQARIHGLEFLSCGDLWDTYTAVVLPALHSTPPVRSRPLPGIVTDSPDSLPALHSTPPVRSRPLPGVVTDSPDSQQTSDTFSTSAWDEIVTPKVSPFNVTGQDPPRPIDCVVKFAVIADAGDERYARIFNEATIYQTIQNGAHSSIVPRFYGLFQHDQTYAMVLERCRQPVVWDEWADVPRQEM